MIWLLCYFFYANGFVDLRVSKSSGIEHTSTSGREKGVWCVVSNRGRNGDNRSLDSCCHVCDHGYFVLSFPVPVEEEQCLKRGHILGLGWTEGLSCTVEQGLSSEKVNFSSFKMSLDFEGLCAAYHWLNKSCKYCPNEWKTRDWQSLLSSLTWQMSHVMLWQCSTHLPIKEDIVFLLFSALLLIRKIPSVQEIFAN